MGTGTHMVVVDGGGTGTRVRLHDSDGRVLAETASGPSSLTLGLTQAWDNVEAAVLEACDAGGLGSPRGLQLRMVAGFAGGRSPSNRAEFIAGDRLGCREIRIVTDGYASLIGALRGQPGVVLAVGTGVTAYSLASDGTVRQSSGWGFPVGDEGGGAWLGHRALQAHLKMLDGRQGGDSAVFDRLAAIIGRDFDGIQAWLAAARATQFASLAPAVTESAQEGDPLAVGILGAATSELEAAIAAVEPDGGEHPIAVLGGLTSVFTPRLDDALRARIVPAAGSALDGLYLIATGDPLREALS